MLYKFKSKAAGDVILLAASGDRMLRLLGREPAPQGILEVADMPAAIQAIEAAVARDEEARRQAEAEAAAEGRTLPPREAVTLRQRMWPVLEMIRRSHAAHADIVWGV
jgi:hypothetical protein